MNTNKVTDALLGLAIGDALGVPFEFSTRDEMKANPVKDMIGFGTHNQPAGTWSDDSSLTFCLAEALLDGYNLEEIASKFIAWKDKAYWSARGKVFDIGMTTSQAISRLKQMLKEGKHEELKKLNKQAEENDNGNGSLMRIIPLLFYIKGKDIREQFRIVWEVSALTHRHIRAAMSCMIYLKIAEHILNGLGKFEAYERMRKDILQLWESIDFQEIERLHFKRIIQDDIRKTKLEELRSGGYVIEVLESSIWFFLQKDSFEATVLSIINIGHDTDTSAAITGGLAGLYYGEKEMPEFWIVSLARMEDIYDLGESLAKKYLSSNT